MIADVLQLAEGRDAEGKCWWKDLFTKRREYEGDYYWMSHICRQGLEPTADFMEGWRLLLGRRPELLPELMEVDLGRWDELGMLKQLLEVLESVGGPVLMAYFLSRQLPNLWRGYGQGSLSRDSWRAVLHHPLADLSLLPPCRENGDVAAEQREVLEVGRKQQARSAMSGAIYGWAC